MVASTRSVDALPKRNRCRWEFHLECGCKMALMLPEYQGYRDIPTAWCNRHQWSAEVVKVVEGGGLVR